jgi:Tol biopolymer transport system component/DNA-binding winged helix-turn-helix (wHTH) protein
MSQLPHPGFRFGDFSLNPAERRLVCRGKRVPLTPKLFDTLLLLVMSAGHLVEKETFLKQIWPDAFVEESSLAQNISVLRKILEDDGNGNKFIETVPKRGYRFVAEVQQLALDTSATPGAVAPDASRPLQDPLPSAKGHFATLRANGVGVIGGAAIVALLSTLAVSRLVREPGESAPVEVVPLVAMQGKQGWPAFTPDGNQVAFAQYQGPQPGIYTTLIGGEKPLRLTENSGDCCPTWSPDGRQIAFVRQEFGKERELYALPALGGLEHRLYKGPQNTRPSCDRLDWSPDGRALLFSESIDNGRHSRIALLTFADSTIQTVTSPPQVDYDCEAAFSPDGLSVAFIRGPVGGGYGDLFVLKLSSGELVRLTSDNSGGTFAWTHDGREIVFSSEMGGLRNLWRITVSGGTPRPVAGVGGMPYRPSISRKGNQLVYQQVVQNENIWRINLNDEKHSLGPPVQTFTARGFVRRPSFSPDGKKVAFESNRLGYSDIWVCESDGSNCSQLTSLHTISGTARWSPDGHHIAFESAYRQFWEVYVIEIPGGQPRLIPTFPGADNGATNWSRDGQWIYFFSDHVSGPLQLWKVPFSGGSPIQVTTNGGVYAIESDDGRFVYYSKYLHGGIWKKPVKGGEEIQVLNQPLLWCDWVLTHNGIYFLNKDFRPNGRIEFFDFSTRETTPIFSLEKPASDFGGLAMLPDGRSLFYGQSDQDDSYNMLVRNFR